MMYQNINNNSFIIGQNRTKNKFLMRSKIIGDLDISKNQKNNTFINSNDYKLSSIISSNYAQNSYFKPKDLKVKLEEFKFDSKNLNNDCFSNENSINSSNNNKFNNENKNNNNIYINHRHADTTILSDYNNKAKIIGNYGRPMKEYNNKKIRNIMYNNFCTLRVNKNYDNSSKYNKERGNREEKNYVNYNRSNNNSLSPKINFKKILLGNASPKIYNINRKDSNNSLKSFSNNSNILDMKDEYIEYLQKKFQNNFQMNSELENSIKELNIRCHNLINDNKLLNETLNERTTKLNELIQENENYKKERKNKKNLYENKIEIYKKENLEKNNIIKNLKEEINRLKNNLIIEKEKNKEYENKLKKYDIEFENRIEEEKLKIKKAYQNICNLNNKENNEMNYYENEIELIKKQSNIYLTNLKSKEKSIELMTKENEKLLNENIIYRTQIEQYSNKISELYDIIKQKEKHIQSYKNNNKQEHYNNDDNSSNNNCSNNNNNSNNNILENKYQITKINYYYFDKKNGKQNSINNISNLNNSYNKLIGNKVFLSSVKMNKLNKDFKNNSFEIRANIFNKNNDIKIRNMRKILIDKKIKKDNEIFIINNRNDKIKKDKIDKIKNKNCETIEKYISEGLSLKEKKEEEKEKDKQTLIKKINSYYSDNKCKDKKEKEKEKRLKIEIEEINEAIKKISQKKNYTYKPKVKKKFQILDGIEVTEINTSSPVIQQNISFSSDKHLDKTKLFLFGIDRKENLLIFDILNMKWSYKKILEIEDISETFKKNYQYDGTIIYNTLNGLFILTGKRTNILYYYNALNDSINRICKFNDSHDNGSLLLDKNNNRIFVFSGKNTKTCEFYSFKDKNIYKIGDMVTDRANASFIINDNKIYGFFGFSYQKENYANSIELIDYDKLEKWEEMNINNFKFNSKDEIKNEIRFDVESAGTIKFENETNKIIIYSGIQGENEDYIINYYYIFDTINKTFNKVNKCVTNQYKYNLYKWKKYKDNELDLKGFHFSKNSNFLILPKDVIIKNYPENMAVLIDYANNIHFIDDKLSIIDIYRANS